MELLMTSLLYAVPIGRRTRKLLFLGVRNEFCSICAKASNKEIDVDDHLCFKNWNGASSSIEQDVIVEGFKCSIGMHGVKYKKFIADGDSTVFAKIRQNVDYGNEVVYIICICSK